MIAPPQLSDGRRLFPERKILPACNEEKHTDGRNLQSVERHPLKQKKHA